MSNTRIEENELALDCIQKTLDTAHGGRIFIVRDDDVTNSAVRNAVVPIPVSVIAATSRAPQRALRHKVVTADSETEVDHGVVKVADGYSDAVKCMNAFLGRPSEKKTASVSVPSPAPAVVPDTPTVAPVVPEMQINMPASSAKAGTMAAYIESLMR